MSLTKDQTTFMNQCRASGEINFPRIAHKLRLNWTKLKGELDSSPEFKMEMEEYLEELKFDLLQKVLEVGLVGKVRGGGSPELSYVNAILRHIDGGGILGKMQDSGGIDEERLSEHLKRFNLA